MKENIGTTAAIIFTAVVIMMSWIFIAAIKMSYQSYNCENYMKLTKIETTMIRGKCHKYIDGQLQVVKELE